jgi:transcriptional regulator with XRE-family HTH domain
MVDDRSSCPSERLHGTESAYRYGCRCSDAREIERLRKKRAREGRAVPKRADAVGTMRRLQALAALGWTPEDLAEQLGMHPSYVKDLRINRRANRVNTSTVEKVTDLFERLSATPGPSVRTRQHAERQGWAPPLAWDDDAIDNPDAKPVTGEVPRSRIDLDDLAFLKTTGMTEAEYAARVGVVPDSIERARERQRERTNTAIARAQEAAEQAPVSWASAPTMAAALNEAFGDTHELAS